jgi:hypothetical protein
MAECTSAHAPHPLYALIEAHRSAQAARIVAGRACQEAIAARHFDTAPNPDGIRYPAPPENLFRDWKATDKAERLALRALVDFKPPTMEAANALIAYQADLLKQCGYSW